MYLAVRNNKLFYLVILLGIIALFYTTPFLRYPYDMIHHLIVIDDFYIQLTHSIQKFTGIWVNNIYIMIPTGEEIAPIHMARPRYLWHYIWAELFTYLDIDSTQMILRAKIIHVTQTLISLTSVYYFSHVVLRNIFKNIPTHFLQWLSLWSVIIWLSIFATASAFYHQVWMMWYSVNYQITLPLFWYILGLTLVLLLEKTSWKIKLFFILQILLLSRFMLQVHSMEFLYYLMHMAILGFVFLDKIYFFLKKYFYIVIPLIMAIIYMAIRYMPEKPLIFNYISFEKLPILYEKIMHEGTILLNGYNRAFASINELMYIIGLFGGLFLLYQIYILYYQKMNSHINKRMLLFITLTSFFVLIPLYQFSGGLFSVVTYTAVVNRLYYSSSLFVVLPIVAYGMLFRYKNNILTINLVLLIVLVSTGVFSKYNPILHHNYYKNIQSMQNSFQEKKVGFNLSQPQIDIIKQKLVSDDRNNQSNKKIRYYARADIAFVIRYFFHKEVYWKGRRTNLDYIKAHDQNRNNKNYYQILFETPKDFPIYRPYT